MGTTIMTPEEIRSALKTKNITVAAIARDVGKTHQAVRLVVNGDSVSHEIRLHIAKCIGCPVGDVFAVKPNPTKKGRPLTKGYYETQAA